MNGYDYAATFSKWMEREPYEAVHIRPLPKHGAILIIAIHNRIFGNALGGIRFWLCSLYEALTVAALLARDMTFKAIFHGRQTGGGKAFILGDPSRFPAGSPERRALFHDVGRVIEELGGAYIGAEDVNVGTDDVRWIAEQTKHVVGTHGDPSDLTSQIAIECAMDAMRCINDKARPSDLTIAIQGIGGHVGTQIVRQWTDKYFGGRIVGSEVHAVRRTAIQTYSAVRIVPPEEIFDADVDILFLAALHWSLNDDTCRRIKAKLVVPVANIPFEDEERHPAMLHERGILCLSPPVINGGGLRKVLAERNGGAPKYRLEWMNAQASDTVALSRDILDEASASNLPPPTVALRRGKEILASAQA